MNASEVLAWSQVHRRDLPWRLTRDPWAILVSEVMLAQTQVSRVVPAWQAFVDRFPSPAATAAAPVGAVIAQWSGLGYNRRAVALHRCAVEVTDRHGGHLPADLPALLALPGVGAYTARAVLAFAFGRDVGVVDTNVARVLARAASGRPLRAAEAQRLADGLVPAGEGWAWNQALIDLGATVCRARLPACDGCPVTRSCAWAGAGWAGADPAVGTHGTGSRQSRFAGSDRQGRGRLVAALRDGPISEGALAAATGWPDDAARAQRILAGLIADGLVVPAEGGGWGLPGV